MKVEETFTVCNNTNGVIATRNKASVEINSENNEIKMHDFIYTFEEIIAISDKLQSLEPLTFS